MRVWIIAIVAALVVVAGVAITVVSMRAPGTAPQTIPPEQNR